MPTFTTSEICDRVGGRLVGPSELEIRGVESLDRAADDHITFITTNAYARTWSSSRAGAALVGRDVDLRPESGRAVINVDDANIALAAVLEMFAALPSPPVGVHPSAAVDPAAEIGQGVAIGPQCTIGPRVRIGDGTVLQANVTVLDDSTIGAGCMIWPGVVIRDRTEIGDGCILHSNVTLGTDGYGYTPSADGRSLVKIPQIGHVKLGRGVELGSNTCVDRGKFSATVIGDGTKIDNLCQIAHNAQIGRSVIIAGLSGIGGSAEIGDGVLIAGGCHISDHVVIGPGARIGGSSSVIDDVPPGAAWQGTPAHDGMSSMREHAAMKRLPALIKEVRRLKAEVRELRNAETPKR